MRPRPLKNSYFWRGRCNFTNLATGPDRFLSDNPRFAASALARYRPQAFVDLVDRAGIAWHEKTQGQLFCDGKATQITDMLLDRMAGADLRLGTRIDGVSQDGDRFVVASSGGPISTGRSSGDGRQVDSQDRRDGARL
ncbi:NAD(P)/FAD-dependent oxidoreductase [Paracoccus marcusii]|nr:NAD(P)/FAD-dependent oxidoreductase [Paracoccus marcusii]